MGRPSLYYYYQTVLTECKAIIKKGIMNDEINAFSIFQHTTFFQHTTTKVEIVLLLMLYF